MAKKKLQIKERTRIRLRKNDLVEVIAGRDPQLEKAIEVVMEQLEPEPATAPERPAFPRPAVREN